MAWIWWPQDTLFHARGGEKCPGGVQQHMQKGHVIYAFWITVNGERGSFLEIIANKTLFKKDIFSKIQTMKKYVGE